MSLTTWSFPTRIVFGAGAVKEIGSHARSLGGEKARALVVTDPGVVKAGVVDAVRSALDAAGVAHATFDGVHPNPLEKDVHDGLSAYRNANASLVVAVGGGSPLDVAKLIRLLVTHDGPLAQYDDAIDGGNKITKPVPPMIAVPTTAGTGSEVGRSGVVTIARASEARSAEPNSRLAGANSHSNEKTHRKTVVFSPRLLAEVAILDPELTVGMPARTTAATGFDALTHCIEAYLSLGDHPMADAIALGGIELCVKSLAKATHAPKDLEARGDMMKAAMMGAVAFQKGLGACHSLAHPLSSEKGLHHGLANALCLPAVVAWNAEKSPERVARIASIFGVDGAALPRALAKLRADLGLPGGLRAEGVSENDLEKLADLAIEDACHRCNPRPCTRADLLALYRASL